MTPVETKHFIQFVCEMIGKPETETRTVDTPQTGKLVLQLPKVVFDHRVTLVFDSESKALFALSPDENVAWFFFDGLTVKTATTVQMPVIRDAIIGLADNIVEGTSV